MKNSFRKAESEGKWEEVGRERIPEFEILVMRTLLFPTVDLWHIPEMTATRAEKVREPISDFWVTHALHIIQEGDRQCGRVQD